MANSVRNFIPLEKFTSVSTRLFSIFDINVTVQPNGLKWPQKVFAFFNSLISTQGTIFLILYFDQSGMFLALTFTCCCVCYTLLCILKFYIVCFRKRNLLREVIDMLNLHYLMTNHEQSKFSVRKVLNTLNNQNWTYCILSTLLACIFVFSDILISIYNYCFVNEMFKRHFPYFLWFPFDTDVNSPIVFEVYFMVAVYCSFSCIIISVAIDLIYCSCLTVLCMEFYVLRVKFQDINEETSESDVSPLIREHSHLIRFFLS